MKHYWVQNAAYYNKLRTLLRRVFPNYISFSTSLISSVVVNTTFVDIYVDTKNIPTCRYNIQHIDKRTMENKMSIIM